MNKFLIYWFIGNDVHIEHYNVLSIALKRKKDIAEYIFYTENSDVFLYELRTKRRKKWKN